MSHLAEEILRRSIDEPDALLSYEKEHLLECVRCRSTLERLREHAAFAAARLGQGESTNVDVEKALGATLRAAQLRDGTAVPLRVTRRDTNGINLRWVGALAAALALFFLLGYSPLRGYAANFLAIFEPHQFQPIGISTTDIADMRALPNLKNLGTMHQSRRTPGFNGYSDTLAASHAAGYTILRPHFLPPGVPSSAIYHVAPQQTSSFTFSAAKAPSLPANLDGATISVTLGPVSVQTYGEKRAFNKMRAKRPALRNMPSDILVVTQSPAMHVYSNGATVAQIEAYLLGLPHLPAAARTQIQAITDPSTAVPVPFNVDKQSAQQIQVHGAQGIVIGDNTGVGAIVLWQQNGTVYCVAGPYAASVVEQVANSLAP